MPAPSIPIQGWDRNDHARRVRRGDQMRLALACLLLAAAVAWIAVLKQRHVPAPVDCVAAPEPLVHREMQGPVPLAPGYGTQPPLKRRRTGGGRRDRRRRRARREGPPAIVINVARADDNGDGWRQIAREARQRAERAEMRHLELDRDLLAAQAERQDLIGKLAKGAEEALRLERQLSDAVAQVESLRLDDEAHRQHWQQMHDQMQEQRRRAEQAEVERDAAQARIVELLGEGQELRQTHAAAATTTARRLISEARNLTGWRDDTAEGSSVAVTATDRPDPPRAIRLLITRPAPTHETIQCLFKWIGGISLGETHRVLVDLCNMGRIVNRGLPWGYRLVDEAAVHMEPPAPLGTTPGGYEVSAESPAAPPAARLRSLLGHEPVRPVGWSADMWGAFPGEGFPEDGPVLLAYRDTLRNVVESAAGLGCDLTILPCAVDGAFDNDVSAIPADVPTGQEDQHDADMRAEEAHDFGETRCRRCNRHRLDAAAPCVRA